jgi:hypothetical protein
MNGNNDNYVVISVLVVVLFCFCHLFNNCSVIDYKNLLYVIIRIIFVFINYLCYIFDSCNNYFFVYGNGFWELCYCVTNY